MKLDSFAVIDGKAIVRVEDGDQTIERTIALGTVKTMRTQTERYWEFRDAAGHRLCIQVGQRAKHMGLYLDDGEVKVADVHFISRETVCEIFAALGIAAPEPWLSCPVCYGDLAQSGPGKFVCAECVAKAAAKEAVHA